jgi:hypothetical protein
MLRVLSVNRMINEPVPLPEPGLSEEEIPADALSVVSDVGALRDRIEDLEKEAVRAKSRETDLRSLIQGLRIDITTLATSFTEALREGKRIESVDQALAQEAEVDAQRDQSGSMLNTGDDLRDVIASFRTLSGQSETVEALASIAQRGESVTGKRVFRLREI